MEAEVEVKFLADGPGPLEALARANALGMGKLGPPTTVDEVDIYLDTADGLLAAAGWVCRHRDRGTGPIVSMKGPALDGPDGIHRRHELEGAASASHDPAEWPAGPARDRLREMTGDAPLIERLTLHQRRTERPVIVDGSEVATLSLDQVRVDRSDATSATFHVVEVELASDDPASVTLLGLIASALAGVPGLTPDHRTKLDHALASS
jgi:inorganic triphosphatase YgiF